MKVMRKVWILIIACLILLTFNSIYAEETKPRKNYQIIRDIECGEIYIKAVTHCLVEVFDTRNCLADKQYIIFNNRKEKIQKILSSSSKSYNFNLFSDLVDNSETIEKFKNKQVLYHYITDVVCYKDKKGSYYIGLEYYSGGNCPECEYFEIYDKFGELVITDRDKIIYKNEKISFNLKIYKQAQRKLQNFGLKIIKKVSNE